MSSLSTLAKQDKDGGYYAIKGFLYQFDRTLIEMFSNPGIQMNFECQQDIDYDNYIIQVKHKEAADFTFSSIRPAIRQLIDLFNIKKDNKFRLYCHFKNKLPSEKEEKLVEHLSLDDLNQILATEQDTYSKEIKEDFIKNFKLIFLHDFNRTFNQLIKLIKLHYGLSKDEVAIYYHAIFQTELSRLSIQSRSNRSLSTNDLDVKIETNNKIVFFEGYQEHLSQEKYFQFIKNQYFTHKKAHVVPHERVFIVDCAQNKFQETLIDIVYRIRDKFFRTNASPAPFICLRNLDLDSLHKLKRTLLDQQIYFNDGTFFNGDRIRFEELCKEQESIICIRFIHETDLANLERLTNVVTYQFFTDKIVHVPYKSKEISISIKDTANILNMIS